jgi:hypothetical protein
MGELMMILKVSSTKMKIGQNLWPTGWGTGWSDYFKPSLDWASVTDPWVTQFLTDVAAFNGPIRFMDWCGGASSPLMLWANRRQKTESQYVNKTYSIDSSIAAYVSSGSISDVAFEWMVDLCNRTNRDMWINVPTFCSDDFVTQLATLIHTTLNSNLKCYVEYSNETWNGAMASYQYCIDKGVVGSLPGMNQYYQGYAWSLYRSLQVFKLFSDVFGTDAATRLKRVYAFSGNLDGPTQALRTVAYSGTGNKTLNVTWNTVGQEPDFLAIAPYIGPADLAANPDYSVILDGSQSDIAARFRANVDYNYLHYITPALAIATEWAIPMVCYEGGQQLTTNAGTWSANAAIYDEYLYMLNKWIAAGFVFFCHYTLYGYYASGGAWGAKALGTTLVADAPKYRALIDWLGL